MTKYYAISDPKDIDALYNKAIVLEDLERYDEALQYYDKVLAIDPKDIDALYNKAIVLEDLERYDEAHTGTMTKY